MSLIYDISLTVSMELWATTTTLVLDAAIVSLLVFIITFLFIRNYWRYRNLPPGPKGYFLVGNLFQLGSKPWETLTGMSKKYGGLFSVKLGFQQAVVLNDYEAVREAFIDQADIFSDRPAIYVFDYFVNGRDIASANGKIWNEKRKFMLQNVKTFGFGKSSSDALIMENVQMVMDELDESQGRPFNFQQLFILPIANVIWKFSANHHYQRNNPDVHQFKYMLRQNNDALGNQFVNYLPLLRFVPGGFGFWKQQKSIAKAWQLFRNEIETHRKSFTSGEHRDLIDIYLQEMKERSGNSDAGKAPYNDEHMTGTLYDLFMAGIDTATNTLLWGFLLLAVHLDVQLAVQKEMDDLIGRGRLPCFSDFNRLPYLDAMIQEVHRYISLVPLSIAHSPRQDTTVRGYKIPRGTVVIQNIHALHHDPKYWNAPDQFRPERFLDANRKVVKPPYFMPFSVGPRRCPGEPVARMELQLFFGCLLHKYSFRLPTAGLKPDLEPIVGISLAPKPFSLCVLPR